MFVEPKMTIAMVVSESVMFDEVFDFGDESE